MSDAFVPWWGDKEVVTEYVAPGIRYIRDAKTVNFWHLQRERKMMICQTNRQMNNYEYDNSRVLDVWKQ